MINFYVRKCEKDNFNIFDVPVKFQTEVRLKIEADGYTINEEGYVVK